MPMTYRACVVVVYMFDMRHNAVMCYTVSRDQAHCHSTVYLNLKNSIKIAEYVELFLSLFICPEPIL